MLRAVYFRASINQLIKIYVIKDIIISFFTIIVFYAIIKDRLQIIYCDILTYITVIYVVIRDTYV